MTSLLKKTVWLLVIACGSTATALGQSTFFEVRSTPYDHQMQRIQPALTTSSGYGIYGPSLSAVNHWMTELRGMPYRYSPVWKTPLEVEAAQVGDCKGKALLLYDWMQSNGAKNVRLVIGKRRAESSRTHAWLEWQTRVGTLLLDPTFNWNAAMKLPNRQTYVAFYGYEGPHKYRAGNSVLANRNYATRTPAAPAHGVVTRPVRPIPRTRLSVRSFDEGSLVDPRLFWNRTML